MKRRSDLGWGELVIGIALILLGILTFARPAGALTGIVFVYGIFAVITGIADIAFYIKMERHTGFGPAISLVTGILSVLAGILLLLNPGAGGWALLFLFPIWFIAHCISRLSHLTIVRLTAGTGYYYFTMIANILGLVLGFMMLFRPLLSFFSVTYLIGFYFILMGIDHIVVAVSGTGLRR